MPFGFLSVRDAFRLCFQLAPADRRIENPWVWSTDYQPLETFTGAIGLCWRQGSREQHEPSSRGAEPCLGLTGDLHQSPLVPYGWDFLWGGKCPETRDGDAWHCWPRVPLCLFTSGQDLALSPCDRTKQPWPLMSR